MEVLVLEIFGFPGIDSDICRVFEAPILVRLNPVCRRSWSQVLV